jgi:hypothetical protein
MAREADPPRDRGGSRRQTRRPARGREPPRAARPGGRIRVLHFRRKVPPPARGRGRSARRRGRSVPSGPPVGRLLGRDEPGVRGPPPFPRVSSSGEEGTRLAGGRTRSVGSAKPDAHHFRRDAVRSTSPAPADRPRRPRRHGAPASGTTTSAGEAAHHGAIPAATGRPGTKSRPTSVSHIRSRGSPALGRTTRCGAGFPFTRGGPWGSASSRRPGGSEGAAAPSPDAFLGDQP